MKRLVWVLVMLAPVHDGAFASVEEEGRRLAQKLCARCHAIDPEAPWNSLGSTPSFMLMAKKPERYEQRVLTVTERRPHIAQRLTVTPDDLERILAYIRTLKRD